MLDAFGKTCSTNLRHVLLVALGAVGLAACSVRLEAAVVVLSNQGRKTVRIALRTYGAKDVRYSLGPGKLIPVHVPDRVDMAFATGDKQHRQLLDVDTVYYFVDKDKDVAIEQIAFSRSGGGSWLHVDPAGRQPPPAVVSVKLLVDDEQPAVRGAWERRLREQFGAVSNMIERYCRVRFEVVAVDTWESNNTTGDFAALGEEFKRTVGPDPARLVIGFTSQFQVKNREAPLLPMAPFASHLLVPDLQKEFTASDQFDLLLHMLGHYLGAVHSARINSVMNPSLGKQASGRTGYDPINTLVMNLVGREIRDRQVRSPAGLSRGTRQYLAAIYSELAGRLPADREIRRVAALLKEPELKRSRYTAAWVDGSRLAADEVGSWHDSKARPQLARPQLARPQLARPQLGGRALFDEKSPVRWLVNNELPPAERPEAMVEFVGGDRLPGRVVGFSGGVQPDGRCLAPHLLVETPLGLNLPDSPTSGQVRVRARWVSRIVWRRATDRYTPQTLFARDGSRFSFRSVQFDGNSARLLREEGIREFPIDGIAELHMPAADPWEAYFEQLAVLSPDCSARLVRLETVDGLRMSGSAERFRAEAHGAEKDRNKPDNWYHLLQPAWSLEPFWLHHPDVRLRCYFMPHEVSLSMIRPDASRQQSDLGGIWHWQLDRDVQGEPLRSGGQAYQWGLGVHAMSELEFPLADCARTFQTRLGLSERVGSGGCVSASILLARAGGKSKSLYASPLMLGSADTFDTGPLSLETETAGARRLILRVDPAHKTRPRGADPLDIGDVFNWLQPQLELDPTALRAEVLRRAPDMIPAWRGWKAVAADKPAVRLVNYWDESGSTGHKFRLLVSGADGPVTLSRKLRIGPAADRLMLGVSRPVEASPSKIDVRLEGRSIEQFDVPVQPSGRDPEPLGVSLAEYQGRQVDLELIQEPQDEKSLVRWWAVTLIGQPAE